MASFGVTGQFNARLREETAATYGRCELARARCSSRCGALRICWTARLHPVCQQKPAHMLIICFLTACSPPHNPRKILHELAFRGQRNSRLLPNTFRHTHIRLSSQSRIFHIQRFTTATSWAYLFIRQMDDAAYGRNQPPPIPVLPFLVRFSSHAKNYKSELPGSPLLSITCFCASSRITILAHSSNDILSVSSVKSGLTGGS